MTGSSSRCSSGDADQNYSFTTEDFNIDETIPEDQLDAMIEELSRKTLEMERLQMEHVKETTKTMTQMADKIQKVNDKARLMNHMVHTSRLQNAKQRAEGQIAMNTMQKVMEADPETQAEVAELRADSDTLLEAATSVHREFYHYERLFNTADILQKMTELTYQTMVLEDTLKINEQPMKDIITFDGGIRGILSLGHEREEEAKELAERIHAFATNGYE